MKAQPNILWVCTDQQRFDTIGALGNSSVHTPNIDRLVRQGTAFTHAFCQSPICTPSRASFLTGMYPSAVHVNGNGNDQFPQSPRLVTKLLAEAGYRCGNVGKLHLASAYKRAEPRVDDGYSYFKYSHAPRDDWAEGHDYADWLAAAGHSLKELTASADGVPEALHQTTWCADMAIAFIEQQAGSPWALTVNIYDPHPPFNPPKRYRDMFDPAQMPGPHFRPEDIDEQRRLAGVDFQSEARQPAQLDIANPVLPKSLERGERDPAGMTAGARDAQTLQAAYYAMIKLIDDQMGRILATLERQNLADDTIIIFMSDHGETLGDHGLIQKGCRFYEGLVRVPLIVSCPGRLGAGVRSDALVELLDVTPTLLDLAGIEVPANMQGKSLLPILVGEKSPAEHRDFVRCEFYDALDLPDGTLATMYRERDWKIVHYHQHGFGELFDLQTDPWEHHNLWDDPAHEQERFRLTLASYNASIAIIDRGAPRIGPY
ncbi:sulfatase-like hydrolase/transferase [Devosia rhodophyticola]|uniref:Sulfatase-like hydrolase/transferase n=1 Tax=Devosia rhodophyticola TaxID=3026423 RepID=A0ABY7YTZ4_9HYPH|nr:sulfatase-like hydrolase/transferase [Devosia rhodophyticola]WDR04647.1 sulfatase-like hydrolase/transferase [Devosia rhodophyticola]